jgi:hypothetical protein
MQYARGRVVGRFRANGLITCFETGLAWPTVRKRGIYLLFRVKQVAGPAIRG